MSYYVFDGEKIILTDDATMLPDEYSSYSSFSSSPSPSPVPGTDRFGMKSSIPLDPSMESQNELLSTYSSLSVSSSPSVPMEIMDSISQIQSDNASISNQLQQLSDDIEVLSAASTASYPSASFVDVFRMVLQSLPSNTKYYVFSGSDSTEAYLYYSKNGGHANGNILTLDSDITICRFYRYRPSSSSAWQYHYSVSTQGSGDSLDTTGYLVYTNLLEGYPDLLSQVERDHSSLPNLFIVVPLILIALFTIIRRK